MLIGIDGNEANVEKRVGVSEFAFELLSQFKRHQVSDIKYQVYLKSQLNGQLPEQSEGFRYRIFGPGKAWTQWRLPLDLYIHRPRPDVFFTPSHYSPRFSPIPTVVSVMDLSYIYYPELFNKSDLYQLKNWTKYSVSMASAVITISRSSQFDIIKEYKIPEEKVYVVHPGIKLISDLEPHVYPMSELSIKYRISNRYILFVGTLQPRKNIERLIEGFSKISNIEKDLQLVIIGKKGWQFESILQAPEKFGVLEKVKFLDFVPDEDLPLFYKNAICFVLPSLYEGFGLPILEAMKHNCPVITSNVSSMPEAGENACLYIDPENVEDISKNIKKLIEDDKLRITLIKKGKEHIKKFSWEKTAKETLAILEKVGNES